MLDFDNAVNKTIELEVGMITIENTSKLEKIVEIYVPNRYDAFTKIPAGCTIKVSTRSAGESFMYLAQNGDGLKVTLEPNVASVVVDNEEAKG